MISLVLATVFAGAFGIVMRYGQRARCDMAALAAVNYLAAALYHLVRAASGGPRELDPRTLLIGLAGGGAYVTAFFFLSGLMRRRGVTIGTSVLRLGSVIPMALSVIIWRQTTTPLALTGGLMALASLPLLSLGPAAEHGQPSRRGIPWILATFLGQGACLMSTLTFSQTGIQGQDSHFLGTLFGTAALVAAGAWLRGRLRHAHAPRAPAATPAVTIGLGVSLGLCNALGNQFLVMALGRVPGMLVYPFHSAVGLLITVLYSRLAWSERIRAPEAAGIALALGSVVLMNLR